MQRHSSRSSSSGRKRRHSSRSASYGRSGIRGLDGHACDSDGDICRSKGRVTVGAVKRTSDGKRVRDKKLVCFVCRDQVLWLSCHLSRNHSTNFLVAQVLSKSDKARVQGWKRLKNLGSFKHNVSVLKKGKGELILVRRSDGSHPADSYLPCTQCYGFYFMYDLWRHKCPAVSDESTSSLTDYRPKDVVDCSRNLLEGALGAGEKISHVDENLDKYVLKFMRNNEMLKVIKSDWLILRFGAAQLKRIGIKGQRRIACRMRMLARLLTTLDSYNTTLADFLDGSYFDAVIEVVEDLCGLHTDSYGLRTFKTPSLALAVGNILPKCCQIKKGVAIRKGDDVTTKEVERFMDLFKSDYSDNVLCPALSTLKLKSYKKPDELPITEDLMKLKVYTEKLLKELTIKLKSQPSYSIWRKLSEIVLTRLLVFNKRRASKPVKLELTQYLSRPNWQAPSNQEVIANLQPLEKKTDGTDGLGSSAW